MASSRIGNRFFFLVALCLTLATTSSARADADTARAKQLYAQGVTSYNLGHYDEALTAFEMGYRLRQDSAFLFNIAQCQRMLNRYQDAERTYRAYLRESPGLPDANRDQIQTLIAEMEKAIEEQRSKQPPTGTRAPAAAAPSEQQAATPPPQAVHVPSPAITPTAPSSSSSVEHHRTFRRVGIGLLIAGVAVVGVGGGLAGYSSSLYSQAKSATVLGDQRDLKSRSDIVNDAGWPLIGVGCAAIVGGAVTLALSFRGGHAETRTVVQR